MSPSSSGIESLWRHPGARCARDNLKNISLDIPRRRITVFTGVSGMGKSSLVFDTIAAESQRLINETFSTFVQYFLPRYGQPDADALHNLSTAIIVDQQRLGGNPRSTLGTVTDIYTLLRVLFSVLQCGSARGAFIQRSDGMCPECEALGRGSRSMSKHWWIKISLLKKAQSVFQRSTWWLQLDTFVKSGFFDVKKPRKSTRKRSGTIFYIATIRRRKK